MATRRRNSPPLYLLLCAVALASMSFHFRSMEQCFLNGSASHEPHGPVRLQDLRAWLLLAVLLSVATAFDSFPYLREPGWRLFGCVYRTLFDTGGIGCLFLLGLYFLEPFRGTR